MYSTDIRLDPIDKAILRELRENSRVSIRSLARKLKLAPSTVYERIKKLESHGVIKNYTVDINYRLLGYQLKALILAVVDGEHILEVEEEVARSKNVVALYDITGEYDVAIIAVFKTIEELDNFVKSLLRNPYIKHTTTSVVFRTIKEKYTLPIE
ncbi:MAG: AsnC family transcriptional regulator [Thermoprotei archaeon]|nr:MAG: AsnC family transcriptional regulator [Thermoprotei archaeon]